MDMNPWERRQKILEVLCLRRQETSIGLAQEFNVSRETIRRDITILTCSSTFRCWVSRRPGLILISLIFICMAVVLNAKR